MQQFTGDGTQTKIEPKKYQITNKVTEVIYCYCEETASLMKATETGYKSSVKSAQTIDAVCRLGVEVCGNRFFVPIPSHFIDFIPIPI